MCGRLILFSGGDLGKLQVVNDLVDGLLYLGWMFHLLNYLEVQTGVAVKVTNPGNLFKRAANSMDDLTLTTITQSIFSIGATGTLVSINPIPIYCPLVFLH